MGDAKISSAGKLLFLIPYFEEPLREKQLCYQSKRHQRTYREGAAERPW
jgi:hypothetical protein